MLILKKHKISIVVFILSAAATIFLYSNLSSIFNDLLQKIKCYKHKYS